MSEDIFTPDIQALYQDTFISRPRGKFSCGFEFRVCGEEYFLKLRRVAATASSLSPSFQKLARREECAGAAITVVDTSPSEFSSGGK
ncbi:unnamed protein product [Hermetia illucens]|uniref:Uncharacterized protein n=1 Tax=Hermetia illucens TaxID=343691 RepID=A0A7R8UYT5_HERIL|nr:unnamed protein product [Hermetia illucens]